MKKALLVLGLMALFIGSVSGQSYDEMNARQALKSGSGDHAPWNNQMGVPIELRGAMVDSDPDSILISGYTFSCDPFVVGCLLSGQNGRHNLLLLRPVRQTAGPFGPISGTYVGRHYYLDQVEGRNAIGLPVPIYRYGSVQQWRKLHPNNHCVGPKPPC